MPPTMRPLNRLPISADVGDVSADVRRLFEDLARQRPERRHQITGECLPLLDVFETHDALELVLDRETHEALVPFNAAGEAAAPFNAVVAACKNAGLWPFAAGNRLQIAPPLIISEEDLVKGLDIIDEALTVADSYYTGK